ncbi:hypothetical protein [Alcanivorax sp.]|uniref:phage tail terminator protein n=1 Tax=Alcanivorax sp. TaxID=1872427 RepID=UPI000C0CE5EE|nr:hypothetical protein [Alcanivorax sp.]PHR68502.1 MAG: hypothetical protein COA55_00345 [Alcanivorax sp.]
MSAPLDTTVIEQRLRDAVKDLQQVKGAAEFAAVTSLGSYRVPSAYVVLAREEGTDDPNGQPGRRPSGKQQAKVTFGVITAVRNYRDSTGAQAARDASPLIGQVREALMGWQPADRSMRPIGWLQGDVLDYDASVLLWIDVFTTTHFIGGNAP